MPSGVSYAVTNPDEDADITVSSCSLDSLSLLDRILILGLSLGSHSNCTILELLAKLNDAKSKKPSSPLCQFSEGASRHDLPCMHCTVL